MVSESKQTTSPVASIWCFLLVLRPFRQCLSGGNAKWDNYPHLQGNSSTIRQTRSEPCHTVCSPCLHASLCEYKAYQMTDNNGLRSRYTLVGDLSGLLALLPNALSPDGCLKAIGRKEGAKGPYRLLPSLPYFAGRHESDLRGGLISVKKSSILRTLLMRCLTGAPSAQAFHLFCNVILTWICSSFSEERIFCRIVLSVRIAS